MASKNADKIEKKIEKSKFQAGEQVLCYHGPLIYEAKCINIRCEEGGIEYLIHYNGWNKSWDEWVAEDRLLKYNEENLLKKTDLDSKNQKPSKKGGKRKSSNPGPDKDDNSRSNSPKPPIFARKSVGTTITQSNIKFDKLPSDTPPSIQRKRKDIQVSPETEFHDLIEITIQFSEELQNLLILDCELICKRKKVSERRICGSRSLVVRNLCNLNDVRLQLCKIPARLSVNDITDKYILHKSSISDESSKFKETAIAMRNYFDATLGHRLLYPLEKSQYQKFVESKADVKPSSVYCIVHFVRMFAILGKMLAHLCVNDYGTSVVEENINDYLRYLSRNINKFICIDDYQSSTVEHQRKLRV